MHSIYELSIDECKVYHKSLIANAEKKWAISELLRKNEFYDDAVSYHLICIEEYVKSLVMMFDANGFEFRKVKGMDVFFKHHKIRFFIAYLMFALSLFGEDFIKWIKNAQKNPEKFKSQIEKIVKNKDEGKLPLGLKIYILKKMILLRKEIAFFKSADVLRQLGFYIDFDLNNGVTKPISKKLYIGIHTRLEKVMKTLVVFTSTFDILDEKTQAILTKAALDFKENGVYEQLEIALKSNKKNPNKIFELIENTTNDKKNGMGETPKH